MTIVKTWKLFLDYLTRLKPEEIVLLSFGAGIAVGALILWLPISHIGTVGLSEAFFTAASAVCVTGLVVVDTGRDFTLFGQCVIMLLIQLGGLGVMTFAALAFDLLGKRLPLNGQEAMTSELVQEELRRGYGIHFRRMLRLVLLFEALGALMLFIGFLPSHQLLYSGYTAIFHSISAFCNAGFSLYSDSLIPFRDNPIIIPTISLLIVIGGIGHPVIFDLYKTIRLSGQDHKPLWKKLNVHTRITILMTFFLLAAGFVLLLFTGFALPGINWGAAVFQSVTARTAGFNTVIIGNLPSASLLVIIALMFIGGSPGSCAGGIKTTTLVLWIGQLWSTLKGKTQVVIQGRWMPETLVRRSSTIISIAIIWNVVGIFILSITESGSPAGLHDIFFEQISAFATVGLSTGLTTELSEMGRLWIIATMFIGRTGPLTGVLLLLRKRPVDIRYPEGKVMIG